MTKVPVDIGKPIQKLRIGMKLTQTEFGKLGGVSLRSQIAYEKGDRRPSVDYLINLHSHGVDACQIISTDMTDTATSISVQRSIDMADKAKLDNNAMKNLAEAMQGMQNLIEEKLTPDEKDKEFIAKFHRASPEIQTAIKGMLMAY